VRVHSHAAAKVMKEEGKPNDLLARMRDDDALGPHVTDAIIDPKAYVGRAPEQVDAFVADVVDPLLEQFSAHAGRFAPRVRV
jgi:adenylosuccinate lyase